MHECSAPKPLVQAFRLSKLYTAATQPRARVRSCARQMETSAARRQFLDHLIVSRKTNNRIPIPALREVGTTDEVHGCKLNHPFTEPHVQCVNRRMNTNRFLDHVIRSTSWASRRKSALRNSRLATVSTIRRLCRFRAEPHRSLPRLSNSHEHKLR